MRADHERRTANGQRPLTETERQEFLRGLQTFVSMGISRAALAQRLMTTHGGQRQLWEVLGYPQELTYEHFLARVRRGDLAKRIVWAYPAATWRPPPDVWETPDDTDLTPFEAAWQELTKRLAVWDTLERVDRLAQIGRYAVLLLNVAGQPDLAQPLQPLPSLNAHALLSLTPYSERYAEIAGLNTNPASPDFGRPEWYRLDLSRGVHLPSQPVMKPLVHASRIIHVAQDLLEDEVYGLPRLEPVWNRLQDVDKVAGGAAEMFWLGALRGLVASLKEGYSFDDATLDGLSAEIDEFVHQLRRWVRAEGVEIKELSSQVASPKDHFDVLIDCIASATGIPRRMLTGSERGELASTQDKENWNARVMEYRVTTPETRILRPLIDRLIALRILPEPAQPYVIAWPDLQAKSESEKATIAQGWAAAIATYAGPGLAPTVVPEGEFRDKILGLPAEPPVEPRRQRALLSEGRTRRPLIHPGITAPPHLVAAAQSDLSYRVLLGLADRLAGRMQRTFVRAVEQARGAISLDDLLVAIAAGDVGRVEQLIPLERLGQDLAQGWTPAMRQALIRAAELAAAQIAEQTGEPIAFDLNASARATQWLKQHGAELVTRVTDEARQQIRQQLEQGFSGGRSATDIAADVRQFLGLTRPQQEAAERFRARLIEQGVSADQLQRRLDAFVRAKIRERGLMIGRTEPLMALNEGQHIMWQEAVADGVIDAQEWVKVWLTAEDDAVDVAICEPIPFMPENQAVPIDGEFTLPDGSTLRHPPAHPGCRCVADLRPKSEALRAARREPRGDEIKAEGARVGGRR
jgi:hypothetical protein